MTQLILSSRVHGRTEKSYTWTRSNRYNSLSNLCVRVCFVYVGMVAVSSSVPQSWCQRRALCLRRNLRSKFPSTCHNPPRRKMVHTASWQQPVRGVRTYVRTGSVRAPTSTGDSSKWPRTLPPSFDVRRTSNAERRTACATAYPSFTRAVRTAHAAIVVTIA